MTHPKTAYILLSFLVLGVSFLFLCGNSREFPMDDAYIHAIYAKNLAAHHELAFNHGEFAGVGATSILWVVLLAGGCELGLDPLVFARALGILCFLVVTGCVYDLSRVLFHQVLRLSEPYAPLAASGLFGLSGNMIWFSLSGMETLLFLALGLIALCLYQRRRFASMSVALALLTLTRTEGVLLGATLTVLFCLRTQRIGDGQRFARFRPWIQRLFPEQARLWFRTASVDKAWARRRLDRSAQAARMQVALNTVLFACCVIPWFMFLFTSTGHALPTSFAGKKLSQMAAMNYFLSRGPFGGVLVHLKPLVFLTTWFFYVLLFVFGGVWMPGPDVALNQVSSDLHLAWLGVALFLIVFLPLLVLGVRKLVATLPGVVKEGVAAQAVVALFVWCLLHNLTYMLMFPSLGTTSRYQAINHLVLWLVLGVGVFTLKQPVRHGLTKFRLAGAAVLIFALGDAFYWRSVYHANVDHMVHARIAAAQFIDTHLPAGAIIAAHDIGAIKYYSNRTIVDLGGLVDAKFTEYQRRRALDRYLLNHHVDFLAIPGKHSTEKTPLYDFLAFLRLDKSPLYELHEIASFEIPHDEWALGNPPTGNYLPSVKIYKVDWTRRASYPGGEVDGDFGR